MVPDEAPKPAAEPADRPRLSQPPRQGGRGRGRRGGRGRRPPLPSRPSRDEGGAGSGQPGSESVGSERELPNRPGQERRPASAATIQETIEEVNGIIETLKDTLDDMDEVLETLELAQRQQGADEQEIEALRRSLRQLQRPREGGPSRGAPSTEEHR